MRSAWTWLLRLATDSVDVDDEQGAPGPVVDAEGVPVLGRDGEPLIKVRVLTSLDYQGEPDEWLWVDPRVASQWDVRRWHDHP